MANSFKRKYYLGPSKWKTWRTDNEKKYKLTYNTDSVDIKTKSGKHVMTYNVKDGKMSTNMDIQQLMGLSDSVIREQNLREIIREVIRELI